MIRRLVLCVAVLAALAGLALSGHVEHSLSIGGFRDDSAPSADAARRLESEFGLGTPDVLVLFGDTTASPAPAQPAPAPDPGLPSAPPAPEASPASRAADALADRARGVEGVTSVQVLPAPPGAPAGTPVAVSVGIAGDDAAVQRGLASLRDGAPAPPEGVREEWTGRAVVLHEDDEIGRADLTRAELVAVPATLVLLVVIFGGVVAALVPVLVGVLALGVTMLVLTGLVEVMPVSVFALNLVTGLALGLAIDYGLLLVTRYRELLRTGAEPEAALHEAVRRTAPTILVSSTTVGLCLAALLAIDLPYLRSMAIAGIVVLVAVVALTLVVVPALLGRLGRGIDRWSIRRVDPTRPGRVTAGVLSVARRYRIPVAVVTIAGLLVLLSPVTGLRLGPLDDRVLPHDAGSRVGAQWLRETRPELATEPLLVLVDSGDREAVDRYAAELSGVPGVAAATTADATLTQGDAAGPGDPALAHADASVVRIQPQPTDSQPAQQDLARAVREVAAPAPSGVAGVYSEDLDTRQTISGRLPLVGLLVVLAMLPVVFLLTGGLLVTVKTVVMAALSLAASLGAIVFVFQEGHLADLLGVTATGIVDATTPVLLFCLAFGLSMDYQVFLLARIREEYDRDGDNARAVTEGLHRTAPIIGAAALLVAVVFLSIGASGVSVVRLLGVGLALAVLVDAFVVRLLLVPALMFLFGRANWWAPPGLRALRLRHG